MSSSPTWPDWFTVIAGGLVLLAFLLDAVLRFLRWLAHPDGDLAPYVTPGSPASLPSHSNPSQLDLFLGPSWMIYPLEAADAPCLS